MTSTHLDALLAAADLSDRADRLMLADAFEEAGRAGEADALRDSAYPVQTLDGEVVYAPGVMDAEEGSNWGTLGTFTKSYPSSRTGREPVSFEDFEQEVILRDGDLTLPSGRDVRVWRWEQWEEGTGKTAYGDWHYSREEAEREGRDHVASNEE